MWFEKNPSYQRQIANSPLQVESSVGLIATGSFLVEASAMIRQHQGEIDNTGLTDSISISFAPEKVCACSDRLRVLYGHRTPAYSVTYNLTPVCEGWFSGMRAGQNWGCTYGGLCPSRPSMSQGDQRKRGVM